MKTIQTKMGTKTGTCPICSTPPQASTITETCLRLPEQGTGNIAAIIKCCTNANAFQKYHQHGQGLDPCIHCEHNQVTESPGSFLEMKPGESARSWLEVHICPHCQTTYTIDPAAALPPS